ncbi:MAG: hypothetical protein ACNS60_19890 [Candidatus Cyclobacteriaceae bacterium M2_1C_046]
MERVLLILILLFSPVASYSQISFIGGINANFYQADPLTELDYFGGIEFKVHPWQHHGFWQNVDIYFTPQYNGLHSVNYRLRSGALPIGISYSFNELWDERTNLIRLIDINIGGYGGYIFHVKNNETDVTDNFSYLDYGVQVSMKMRLFIFYPLFVSYNYGLAYLEEEGFDDFRTSYLQFGIYIPISTWLRLY